MDWISNPEAWIALLTLTSLEIVLGIDNIVFISILAGKLPAEERAKARKVGLALAMLMRIALLFSINWIMGLNDALFELLGRGFSGRDLILIAGGLFLIAKSTHEIHAKIEGGGGQTKAGAAATLGRVLVQIMLLDIVFSLDLVDSLSGLLEEIEGLKPEPGMVISIVVVTDGTDPISVGDRSAIAPRAAELGIPLHTVGLTNSNLTADQTSGAGQKNATVTVKSRHCSSSTRSMRRVVVQPRHVPLHRRPG